MGLDAIMIFRVPKEMNLNQIKALSFDLADAFKKEIPLHIPASGDDESCKVLSVLTKTDLEKLIENSEIHGEQWLEVPLSGRFYAPGYERGPLPLYIAIASWLENTIPDVEVWYGAHDYGHIYRFDVETRDELLEYFNGTKNHHNQ